MPKRIAKTGIAGIAATAVDVVIMTLLIELFALPAGVAAGLGAIVGAAVGFTVSKYWAFDNRDAIAARQVVAYGLVGISNAFVVGIGVQLLTSGLGLGYLVAKVACAGAAFVCISYPAQSRFVFGRPQPEVTQEACYG